MKSGFRACCGMPSSMSLLNFTSFCEGVTEPMTIFLIIHTVSHIYKLETRVESLSFFLVKSSSFMANCKSSPNLQTFPHRGRRGTTL